MTDHLHTSPEEITEYARLARNELERLRSLVDDLEASNTAERDASTDDRPALLADRLERASWLRNEWRVFSDLIDLLALGDRGFAEAARIDPEQRGRTAHHERWTTARRRLMEQHVID